MFTWLYIRGTFIHGVIFHSDKDVLHVLTGLRYTRIPAKLCRGSAEIQPRNRPPTNLHIETNWKGLAGKIGIEDAERNQKGGD